MRRNVDQPKSHGVIIVQGKVRRQGADFSPRPYLVGEDGLLRIAGFEEVAKIADRLHLCLHSFGGDAEVRRIVVAAATAVKFRGGGVDAYMREARSAAGNICVSADQIWAVNGGTLLLHCAALTESDANSGMRKGDVKSEAKVKHHRRVAEFLWGAAVDSQDFLQELAEAGRDLENYRDEVRWLTEELEQVGLVQAVPDVDSLGDRLSVNTDGKLDMNQPVVRHFLETPLEVFYPWMRG